MVTFGTFLSNLEQSGWFNYEYDNLLWYGLVVGAGSYVLN